jgi:3-deoxy-D-manno-octulosonic acid (KDO) 8-phosphate synthase
METHVDPSVAKSDKTNAIKFSEVEKLWRTLVQIKAVVKV